MGNPIYILAGQSNANAMRQEFETALGAALGDTPYYAQTVASGGAPLTWQRAEDDWRNDTELRDDLYATISDTLNADPDAYLAGIIWVQGEADTYPIARADEYAQELQGLIQDIRDNLAQDFSGRDTHHDTFDFVISGLSQNAPDAGSRENWETLRAQQALLAQSSADIQLINPDSIAQINGYNIDELFRDGLHYSNPFQTSLMNALVANLFAQDSTPSNPAPKNVILGSSDGEKLYGSNGDDIIYGGAGWDQYKGRGGNDTFVFTDEDTRWGERIVDFEDTKDDILIDTQTVLSFDDLHIFEHATLDGTVVNYGAGSFVLLGIDPSLISADDFAFI
jgi:Ca2+-binding RTX toxin-like protein